MMTWQMPYVFYISDWKRFKFYISCYICIYIIVSIYVYILVNFILAPSLSLLNIFEKLFFKFTQHFRYLCTIIKLMSSLLFT